MMRENISQMTSFVFGAYGKSAFSEKKRPLVWNLYDYGDYFYAVSEEVLGEICFDAAGGNDWKDSGLRAWLNDDFFYQAFTEEERKAIVRHKVQYKPVHELEEICECEDLISIPTTQMCLSSGMKKSVYQRLLEGGFKGAWLTDGVKVDRVSYVDEEGKIHTQYGKGPEERLSPAPVLWLDKSRLKPVEIREYLRKPQQGILLGNAAGRQSYFYCEDGTYVQVHEDVLTKFAYVKSAAGEAVIVGWLGNRDVEKLVFPGKIGESKVVGVLGEYRDLKVKQIAAEEGIAFIGEEALVFLTELERVQLPSTLIQFPGTNLIGCPCVKKISLPPENEFYVNERDVIYTKDRKTLVKYTAGRTVYTLPDSVEEIAPGAFCDTGTFQELLLPEEMREIRPYTFAFADISRIYLPDTVKKIRTHAFEHSLLKEIEIPESVEVIEESAFAECRQLQKAKVPFWIEAAYDKIFRGCQVLDYTRKERLEETIFCSAGEEILKANTGDIITLGSYLQHAAGELETPIEWIVLRREKEHLLLLSRYALFEKEYDLKMNDSYSVSQDLSVDWEDCELRIWLNKIFLQEAFQESERECITDICRESKKECITDICTGAETQGVPSKIFCLSKEEVLQFLRQKEARLAFRTDFSCVRGQKGRETAWWLRSSGRDKSERKGADVVLADGALGVRPSNAVLSVRPALWLDLNQAEIFLSQSNAEFIKSWFLENNDYLPLRKERDALLELLTVYTIVLEKLSGLAKTDYLIKTGNQVRVVSGPPQKGESVTQMLKMINYSYAYLELNDAKNCDVYEYLYNTEYFSGILPENILSAYFRRWEKRLREQHEGRNFEKVVYKCNRNVFYSDRVLSGTELEVLWQVQSQQQIQFEVFHEEDGKMIIW